MSPTGGAREADSEAEQHARASHLLGMTALENGMNKETLLRMRAIANAATPGQWNWGATPCPGKETAISFCRDNIEATKEPSDYFHEIYLDDGRRTALIGNGKNSAANGEFIATFSPENVLILLDELENAVTPNANVTGLSPEGDKIMNIAPIAQCQVDLKVNGWIPIETAPSDGTIIDIWRPSWGGERCTNMRRVDLGGGNIFYEPTQSGPSCVRDATHWMPVPEAPKVEGRAL